MRDYRRVRHYLEEDRMRLRFVYGTMAEIVRTDVSVYRGTGKTVGEDIVYDTPGESRSFKLELDLNSENLYAAVWKRLEETLKGIRNEATYIRR